MTFNYLGLMAGPIFLGPLDDWRGRRPVIFLSLLGLAATSLLAGSVADRYLVMMLAWLLSLLLSLLLLLLLSSSLWLFYRRTLMNVLSIFAYAAQFS